VLLVVESVAGNNQQRVYLRGYGFVAPVMLAAGQKVAEAYG
jgi:hypothetical protein